MIAQTMTAGAVLWALVADYPAAVSAIVILALASVMLILAVRGIARSLDETPQ